MTIHRIRSPHPIARTSLASIDQRSSATCGNVRMTESPANPVPAVVTGY